MRLNLLAQKKRNNWKKQNRCENWQIFQTEQWGTKSENSESRRWGRTDAV